MDGFSFSFFLYISLGSTIVLISNMGSEALLPPPAAASYLNGLSGGFPLTSLYVVFFGSLKEPLNQNMSLLPCGDTFFACIFDYPTTLYFVNDFIVLCIGL